ncbi:hypothetical protein AB0M02_44160 [Actinoplanes sp. NPDC051861]|uniref:hypothetical protein n=1 Tax=Actinoplanes sp. NPDC051861 TaxID=3155170 RepID=UPI0034421524
MSPFVPEPFISYEEYKNSLGEPSPEQLRRARMETPDSHSWSHQELLEAGPQSAEASQALRKILTTSKRFRFRRLAIVCRRNHTIGEVYRTAAGLVLTGLGPLDGVEAYAVGGVIEGGYDPEYGYTTATDWDATWEEQRRDSRKESVVCLVEQLRGPVDDVKLQCRCTTAKLDHQKVMAYLATGKRRVVYQGIAQRT